MSKRILITGSTDGIGKLAAIKLAKEGHQIYLHGRNTEKLASVLEEVKSASANDNIKPYAADFSDLRAVQNMATNLREEIPKLDVLINNAGVFKSSIYHNDIGLEIRMAVNYFAPYILTHGLIPVIKKSTKPKIINLSSAAQSSVSFGLLSGKAEVSEQEAYAQSKLAILMWSFYLASSDPDLNVIALNPGSLLNTNMVREAYGKFWSPADKGADVIYDLAISGELDDKSGTYFDNDKGSFGRAHPDAYDIGKIENLIINTDAILTNKKI